MVYQFKVKGINKVDPQVAGEVCEELNKTVGLTPSTLLEASTPEDAPLHNEFEWQDDIAAVKYREEQARHLINNLRIVTEETEPVKAFVPLEVKIGEHSNYEPVLEVLQEDEKREKLLARAKWELSIFKEKYENLKELDGVIKAIDELEEQEDEK